MKPFKVILLLSVAVYLLSLAIIYVRSRPEALPIEQSPVTVETERMESDSPASPPPVPTPKLSWTEIETTNYSHYVGNLRGVGFPESLIRCMIKAEVDEMYAPREAALKPSPIPHDAATSQRYQFPTQDAMERMRQLREVAYEKQSLLESLVGTSVPRELIRAPGARNYGAYDYAISKLPLERRETVQRIEEELFYTDDLNRVLYPNKSEELEAFRQCRQARDEALQKVLTPEEWERHHMLTTPCGTELARETVGMEPTGEEFRLMFNLAYQRWQDCGGVYGRSRAVPVPAGEIAEAWSKYNTDLSQALGPERYLDYQMATSDIGRNLRNLSDRYGLSRSTMAQAFQLQTQADALERSGGGDRAIHVQSDLQNLLGPSIWLAWIDAKKSRPQLDP